MCFVSAFFLGCASYYVQNEVFNKYFLSEDFANAEKILNQDVQNQKSRNRVLYLLNKGMLAWLQQNYPMATEYFHQADLFVEDQLKNVVNEALALLTNPATKPYVPEDFEYVMINFYKALSYLEMENKEAALVECRRMNEKLNALNDKYPKNYKNRYSNDAFAHLMMGMIYDSTADYNNAFIAYRNAYRAYEDIYAPNFSTLAPLQLKKDLVRTAYQTGLMEEYEYYTEKFGLEHRKKTEKESELILIWITGLCPVKAEWSINLSTTRQNNHLHIANKKEAINFPFYIGGLEQNARNSLSDLEFIRLAFPKYVERPPVFTKALACVNGTEFHHLCKVEDLNAIAFKSLRDRMLREMSNSLLRFAVKKATENYARSKDENAGAILGILNALTEKADTRNWQTLPHSIYYARLNLKEGENTIDLQFSSPNGAKETKQIQVNVKNGDTKFLSLYNMR